MSIKILLMCRSVPFPPRSGAPLRLWQLLNALSRVGDVDVVSFGEREVDAHEMPIAARWTHLGDDIPEARFSGLGKILKLFRPREYPFENDFCTDELNATVRRLLKSARPDVVVISHWKDALPRAISDHPCIVVDAHNIESMLDGGIQKRRSSGLRDRYARQRFLRRERKLFRAARNVWTTSEVDAVQVTELARAAKVKVIPNAVDTGRYQKVLTSHLERSSRDDEQEQRTYKIGFIGTYFYEPNQKSAMRLIDEIFPIIREQEPKSELWLVGKDPTPEMLEAASRDPRIHVTGVVADTLPYFRDLDLMIVPIVVASGTRLKILEAFAAGLAIVSTAKGAEGIAATNGRELVIAESSEALAGEALRLLRDHVALRSQITAAAELVERSYSWTSVQRSVSDAVAELIK